jgi:hypothetical protein
MKWTDIPASNGENNVFKRNWRSWLGHATVATVVTAFGRWLGLHMTFVTGVAAFSVWFPIVFAVGIGLFYFWREFGIGGNYWSYVKAKKVGHDGESDSVIDFWITLPAITATMKLPMMYAVLLGFIMMVGIYLLSLTLEYDG